MPEFWDLYDIKKNKLGRLHERGKSLNSGEYHLVVGIWIINSDGQILLTQRNPDKPWGNYWENTGGAVIAGEDSASGARRELLEETGIEVADGQIEFLGTAANRDWLTDSYIVRLDIPLCDLKLQAEEVINAKWVNIDEFDDMCCKGQIVPSVANQFNLYKNKLTLAQGGACK